MPSSDFIPQVCSVPVIPFYVRIFNIEIRTWNCRTNVSQLSHNLWLISMRHKSFEHEFGTGLLKLSNLTIL